MNNELHLCLLIWNKNQYRATKAKKETTAPLANDVRMATELLMPMDSIVFLRVREMTVLKETEFGERPTHES